MSCAGLSTRLGPECVRRRIRASLAPTCLAALELQYKVHTRPAILSCSYPPSRLYDKTRIPTSDNSVLPRGRKQEGGRNGPRASTNTTTTTTTKASAGSTCRRRARYQPGRDPGLGFPRPGLIRVQRGGDRKNGAITPQQQCQDPSTLYHCTKKTGLDGRGDGHPLYRQVGPHVGRRQVLQTPQGSNSIIRTTGRRPPCSIFRLAASCRLHSRTASLLRGRGLSGPNCPLERPRVSLVVFDR